MLTKNKRDKAKIPLIGTLLWGFAIWLKYALMMSALSSRMLTVERIPQEEYEKIYRTEINYLIEHNYLSGAILLLWLVYLLFRWLNFLRTKDHVKKAA